MAIFLYNRGIDLAIVIKNGLLIDGTGRPPIDNAIVVIEENEISYVGKRHDTSTIDNGAEVIDAEGKTILPGLIDAHVHYGGSGGIGAPEEHVPHEVMKRLHGFLINGVSTIRSCMDALNWAKQLRIQERKGEALIPRLFISGPCFTAPKGHGTEYASRAPELLEQMARTPTSENTARKMVKELVNEEVDFIKIIIEGRPPFERLEPKLACVIVDEAHKNGFKASVHTHEYEDALHMVKCKANSLEHGAVGIKDPKDEIIDLMKKNGTYYVPTLVVHENLSMEPKEIVAFLDDKQLRRSVSSITVQNIREAIGRKEKTDDQGSPTRQDLERRRNNMRIFHKDLMRSLKWVKDAGIKVVAGSDTGNFLTFPGISLHRELELLTQAGLSPIDAIKAATKNAAELLGTEEKLGTIEKGKLADIVIVDGKPSSNISDIRKVDTVIKNGLIIDLAELANKIKGS